jgi:hypothetical protein
MHMQTRRKQEWGSSGRRFKSCQPDQRSEAIFRRPGSRIRQPYPNEIPKWVLGGWLPANQLPKAPEKPFPVGGWLWWSTRDVSVPLSCRCRLRHLGDRQWTKGLRVTVGRRVDNPRHRRRTAVQHIQRAARSADRLDSHLSTAALRARVDPLMHFVKSPEEAGREHHRDEGIILPELPTGRVVNGAVRMCELMC